jgi:hypothetical protein
MALLADLNAKDFGVIHAPIETDLIGRFRWLKSVSWSTWPRTRLGRHEVVGIRFLSSCHIGRSLARPLDLAQWQCAFVRSRWDQGWTLVPLRVAED